MAQLTSSTCLFTAPERELIRREFGQHFGSYPSVAAGIFLRTWRGGPQAGQPKLPPAVQTMMDRGFVEVRAEGRMYRAVFTEVGLTALRQLAQGRRYLDPIRYAHIRAELGVQADAGVSLARPMLPTAGADYDRLD